MIAAIVIIAAGINYAILKNEHVALDRAIDKVDQETKLLEAETQSELVEINRKVNRFAIKSDLRELNSPMRERPDYVVVRVDPVSQPIVDQQQNKNDFPNLYLQASTTVIPTN